ncbi:glycogen debranching protein [Kibdelosporangium aridum]|uniref:Glycogen debranching protein n=1 Tax=Kibdelosporangium aridum TaxID=2030 RepID=A0A428ZCB0_KIBAR|nr:glycogen debranching protein [Kibdelosporangium aridum]RSM85713.1 glycogen debranching protein [Kibdelosporangium aridum]
MANEFSIQEIPFSRSGAWFDLSPVLGLATYADDVHVVSHRNGMHPVLSLVPVAGDNRVATDITADPAVITWSAHDGRITAVFSSPDTVRISGTGIGMRISAAESTLTPFTGTYFFDDPAGGAVFTSYETGHRFRLTVLSGQSSRTGEQELGTADRSIIVGQEGGPWELVLEELTTARTPFKSTTDFADSVAATREDFTRFVNTVAPWRGDRTPAAELASYVIWSATVQPAGFVTRPAVLMSKHWMDKVWSWDHCFNALALAAGAPDLAWDQFQVVFDHQDGQGALPDSITHAEVLHNFVKPPIHGWTLTRLRERLPDGLPDAELAYRQLTAWTSFWLNHRRAPGQRLPHYEHGNDSGWDNSTVFREERLVQSADLAAFLVLQMKELARLATELGEEPTHWAEQADTMLAAMLAELWNGTRFVSRGVTTGAARASASLLDLMPVVLGEHLPREVFDRLCTGIAEHLTSVGLATELPTSPYYQADGYWRGPVWAPATVLIEDGLRRGGAIELADLVSARFRATCEKSGFAENFDALTGEGLRDRAYTWTASAYLILAEDHVDFARRSPG